jgi:hypothetical protein
MFIRNVKDKISTLKKEDLSIFNYSLEKPINIKKGDCFQFKSENPFKQYDIDTINILNSKDGFIEYQYQNGFVTSDKITTIQDNLSKIDSCNCL